MPVRTPRLNIAPVKIETSHGFFMQKKNIEIRLVKSWPEDDIVELYKTGGWWKDSYEKSGIPRLITGSFGFAVAVDPTTGKAVGMGRIISDGASDAYIQDVVVLQEYRNHNVGKQLVQALVDFCLSRGLLWIGLIAEPGTDSFYVPLGFRTMERYTPMLYHMEE
jgi:aralkylamine N-acetyltransferase